LTAEEMRCEAWFGKGFVMKKEDEGEFSSDKA